MIQGLFPLLCLILAGQSEVVLDRPTPDLLVRTQFGQALDRRISASWKSVPLRAVLRRISADRKLAILLDRRIDPTLELAIDFSDQPLLSGLHQMATRVDADVSVVGNTVFLGPSKSIQKLRTLVQLRTDEIFESESARRGKRQFDLVKRRTFHWGDLEEPRNLIQQIARRYDLNVAGIELIPHDLWAGATLPDANAFEALSLVLVQFDLTFQWTATADGIRIVPIPQRVWLTKTYQPRGISIDEALKRWKADIPALKLEAGPDGVTVHATVEQHEQLAAILKPSGSKHGGTEKPKPTPVRRRQFTLRIQRVAAIALIRKLQSSGIVFQFDEKAFKTAGIDLNQKISMNVEKASADDFFKAMCDPLGLSFSIENVTVTLKPK